MTKKIMGALTFLLFCSVRSFAQTYPKCAPRPTDIQVLAKKSPKWVKKLCRGDLVAAKGVSGNDIDLIIAFRGKNEATVMNRNNCEYTTYPTKQLIKLKQAKRVSCHRKKGDQKMLCRGDSALVKGEGDSKPVWLA